MSNQRLTVKIFEMSGCNRIYLQGKLHLSIIKKLNSVSCLVMLDSFFLTHRLYVAHQAPLSIGFSRQEYWSCHSLLQGSFLTQRLNPGLLHSDFLLSEPPGKPLICIRQVSSYYNRAIKGYLSVHSHAYPHMLIFIKFWIFR